MTANQDSMLEMTTLLKQIEEGDSNAGSKLITLVYKELRNLAAVRLSREIPGQTLQATALVHEAYLKLIDSEQQKRWETRAHFFAAASEVMRRILIDNARKKKRIKRGGDMARRDLIEESIVAPHDEDDLLEVDAALKRLELKYPRRARLVKLRYFAGMTIDEAADALGVGVSTANRDWAFAKAWLYREIHGDQ